MALSYLFAFVSLHREVLALFGKEGISPITSYVHLIKTRLSRPLLQIPTLFFYRSDDQMLQWSVYLGIILSVIALLGILPSICFVLLWVIYFSFYNVGSPFLRFQWDGLLLEVGFAACFVSLATPPPALIMIWLWVLLFRFLFASGLVKLRSGCPEWASYKAMDYHFETQPLPNIGGYFTHNLLKPIMEWVTLGVFFFELVVPFLLLGNAMIRMIGGVLSLCFQFLIMATGNYAFFNLLTIALIASVFDNVYLSWIPHTLISFQAFPDTSVGTILLNIVGAVMVFLNLIMLTHFLFPLAIFETIIMPFLQYSIMSSYGLFAVMTTIRDELIFEGSMDGKTWQPYVFKFKPQALNQRPKQIAPLQPRLDWQLWFVPLRPLRTENWVYMVIKRLLEGSKTVTSLFAQNPFSEEPPKFIRIQSYRYHFSTLKEWKEKGNYWTRTPLGLYMEPVELKDFKE